MYHQSIFSFAAWWENSFCPVFIFDLSVCTQRVLFFLFPLSFLLRSQKDCCFCFVCICRGREGGWGLLFFPTTTKNLFFLFSFFFFFFLVVFSFFLFSFFFSVFYSVFFPPTQWKVLFLFLCVFLLFVSFSCYSPIHKVYLATFSVWGNF